MSSILVYLLCALTSFLCAALLYLNYRKTRTPLLMWSSVCFLGLALNNLLLFLDLVIVPDMDLSVIRTIPAVAGFAALTWGALWDIR